MSKELTGNALILLGTLETGGSETKFVRLAQRFKRQRRPIHVAYLGPPESLLPELEGIATVNLGRRGKWSLRAFRALSSYVKKHSITTIVAVNFYPLAYAIPLILLRRTPLPRVVVSINTSEIQSAKERAFMRLYVPLLKRCEKIVFGSDRQRRIWLKKYNLPECRTCVIYNGVDGSIFDRNAIEQSRESVRESLDIDTNATVIVCVGRLRPEKAHQNLLMAIAVLQKDFDIAPIVMLVGDGEERAAIEDRARQLGVWHQIRMVGSTNDVRPFLVAADVFALTSTAVETFSNAALEATSMGLPVVISDVGGAGEMFPAGSSGTIYPRDDIAALTRALAENIEVVLSGLFDSIAARSRVLRDFSVDAMDAAWSGVISATDDSGCTPQAPPANDCGDV